MQSFATQMLFKMFFTERGHVYLERTASRVIETVLDLQEEMLEVTSCSHRCSICIAKTPFVVSAERCHRFRH